MNCPHDIEDKNQTLSLGVLELLTSHLSFFLTNLPPSTLGLSCLNPWLTAHRLLHTHINVQNIHLEIWFRCFICIKTSVCVGIRQQHNHTFLTKQSLNSEQNRWRVTPLFSRVMITGLDLTCLRMTSKGSWEDSSVCRTGQILLVVHSCKSYWFFLSPFLCRSIHILCNACETKVKITEQVSLCYLPVSFSKMVL